ncbi:MAG TPA: carboxypeptidase regulatory-like domain-containing protein [Candidatus Sulfotelmatobacter sp.]|nr:carboxypeptidase regulatory-like domain-containing protein [Candidatus Sulfotelmatobacter sp.]
MSNCCWVRICAVSCALVLALLGLSSNLSAQQGQATITGTVEDASGALLAGVNVTVTNKDTGVVTKTTTNESGRYTLLYLPVGTYTVQAEKAGFKTSVKTDLVLAAEQQAGANFTLSVGQVSEKVEVSASSQAIETESATLSETVNERAIEELPLNGRNPADLVLLTPGTTNVLQSDVGQHQSYTTFPIETGATSSGGRQGSTVYFLDGAYNQDNYHLLAAPFPNPDATQEFKVIGNNFDARYGFAPGGVVSIVTKSGTNQWHGVLFEYLRNNAVNATDYFTGSTDLIKRNQFGGSIGGPIVKDKLFIFGNYQGTRQHRSVLSGNGYVPTTAMRAGNFAAYCQNGFDSNGLCLDRNTVTNPDNTTTTYVADQLWNPLTDAVTTLKSPTATVGGPLGVSQNAQFQVADVLAHPNIYFPNNQLTGTFDPAALTLLSFMPTNTADQYGRLSVNGWPNINNFNEQTYKVDYNLTNNQRISGRAFINYFNQPPTSISFFSSDRSWTAHWQSYAGTWTWTINPKVVNNFTFSYSRLFDTSNSGLFANGKRICYSQLIAVSDPSTTPCSIEGFSVGGGYDHGSIPLNAQNFNGINRWTWGFSDSLSISKGKHLIVAGVDVMRQYWYENTDWLALPIISWNGGTSGQFTGSSFADFLLGDVGNYLQGGGESNEIHAWMIAPYIADQIKVKPNLTIDIGLRYEPWLAPVVSGGRISSYIPGEQSTRYPNAPTGLVFAGDPGVPSAGLPSDHKRFFDPRIGIAWQPKGLGDTSVRAAFGMFAVPMDYANFNHASDLAPFSPTYQFQAGSVVQSQTLPIIPFSNPWSVYTPLNGQNPFPPFASPGSVPPSSAAIPGVVSVPDGFTPNYTDGRTYTWNLSIEHLFGRQWLAKAAYVGSETDHQSIAADENYGLFFGANDPANGTRLNQAFGQVLIVGSPGTANYQAGEFTLEKKFSNGLQFNANYTYSHTIDWYSTATTAFTGSIDDPRCLKCNRANSSLDVPQVLNLNFVYQMPTLHGSRALNAVIGGWQVSGIWSAHSGNATELYSGQTTAWDDVGGDHLDYAAGKHSVSHNNWRNAPAFAGVTASYLNPSDFVVPQQGFKGNAGRDPKGMFYPGWNEWETGLAKYFNFTERYRLQFRWELFNAFNRETFGCLNNNFSSSQFGQFGCSASTPRTMQFALKLFF